MSTSMEELRKLSKVNKMEWNPKAVTKADKPKSYGDLKQQKYCGYYYWDYLSNVAGVNSSIPNSTIAATANNPNDPDSASYTRAQVYQDLHRRAEKIWVANDATTNDDAHKLFVIESHIDVNHFSRERFIPAGGFMVFYNVFELRLRSPTSGLQYRVSENEMGATP